MIKVSFKGLNILKNRFNRASDRLGDIPKMIIEEADILSSNSKSLAPVLTGKLRSSHYYKKRIEKKSATAEIGFKAKYAPFQDFGTGQRFNLTSTLAPYQEYISKFKGANQGLKGVRARKYLFHHYVLVTRKLTRKTRTRLKNLMKT